MAIINKTGITNGNTIQAEHVTRAIDALSGGSTDTVVATGSFSGSFTGIGAGVTGIVSASYATSASQAVTASYVSYASSFPYTGSAQITGSLTVTGSVNITNMLNLQPSNPLPSAVNGSIAYSGSGDFYFASGSAWYKLTL
jgi:hypothetical protein